MESATRYLRDRFLQRADDILVRIFVKPMWLSLICTKLKSPPISGAVAPSSFDVSTPPLIVQSTPVPAHAMHLRNPRRSMPLGLLFVECNCCCSCFAFLTAMTTRQAALFPIGTKFWRRE